MMSEPHEDIPEWYFLMDGSDDLEAAVSGFGIECVCVFLCDAGDRDVFIQYIRRKWRHKCTSFHGGAKPRRRPTMWNVMQLAETAL